MLTEVYEGERALCSENTLLDKFVMTDITKDKRGFVKFEDTFEINCDGILTVTSKEI